MKERNLLNSKLIEFNNLLRNPCIAPSKPALAGQSPYLEPLLMQFRLQLKMLPLPQFPVLLNWKPLLTRDLEPGITLSDEFKKFQLV
ncbi:hypothetical protein NC651_039289 [Populus alba x Populus x berolinensis]|nr:hypothetical protein NC651_039289 [Populus alba x Populus x berolinensis]